MAAAASLTDALDLLVNETCLAMDTEVCSIYGGQRSPLLLPDGHARAEKPRGLSHWRLTRASSGWSAAGPSLSTADAQSHQFQIRSAGEEDRFRSFLGVPIIHRRQLLGVLVVQQRELRQFDESEESFMVTTPRRWLGSCHSRSSTPFSASIAKRACARWQLRPAWRWRKGGRTAASLLSIRFTARRRWTPPASASASDRAGRGRRGISPLQQAFCRQFAKESAAIFDLYSHLLNDARLKRELFAEIDNGSVAEWAVKQVIETFAEQFAKLQDTYMRERGSDLRALGQRLLFHLDDTTRAPPGGRRVLCWWRMN